MVDKAKDPMRLPPDMRKRLEDQDELMRLFPQKIRALKAIGQPVEELQAIYDLAKAQRDILLKEF